MLRTTSNVSGLVKANTRQALKARNGVKDINKPTKINVKSRVAKRTADNSPKEAPVKKRSALGDMTNAVSQQIPFKRVQKKTTKAAVTTTKLPSRRKSLPVKPRNEPKTVNASKGKAKEDARRNSDPIVEKKDELKSIQEQGNDSLEEFMVELLSPGSQTSSQGTSPSSQKSVEELNKSSQDSNAKEELENKTEVKAEEKNYVDIDADTADPYCMSEYAEIVFKNMRAKEANFNLTNYVEGQSQISANHRAILVDWLVEVQENFELYHETLYLAVKLMDHYLMVHNIPKDKLQLVGATAMFISCKFEERHPPVLDDFCISVMMLMSPELLDMEKSIMKTIDYNLFIPIPYRFLRRFAKAAFANMETLTLARYILEFSLMDQEFLEYKSSHMAAACLLLSLKMKSICDWTPTLIHYTEHTEQDLLPLMLN